MADFIQDEEIMGKAYDSKIMKRLLGFAKPYAGWIFLCILMLLIMTVSNLARPYIMKIAIDDHITAFHQPMILAPANAPKGAVIMIQGRPFVRIQDLQHRTTLPGIGYQIVTIQQKNYLIQAPIGVFQPNGHLTAISGSATLRGHDIIISGHPYSEVPLSASAIQEIQRHDTKGIMNLGLLFFILIIVGVVFNYIQTYLLQWTVQRIIYQIRKLIFEHIQSLSLAFFDRNPVGRLVTRVMNDTQTLNDMYANIMVNIFNDFFVLLGIIIVMLQMNWQLALLAFIAIPLIGIATNIYRTVARQAYRQVRVKLAKINASLSENISGIRIIQLFNKQNKSYEQFEEINRDHFSSSWKEMTANAVFRPSMDLIYDFVLAILIWFGGGRAISHLINFGTLYAFIVYVEQFFQPINDLTEKYNILQSAMASSERIFILLDTDDRIPNPQFPVALPSVSGRIEFDHVWFAYQGEDWVLKDVSFTVEPGQTVAFVGATGAGKSSILSLISRLYDVQKGSIRVDGIDIRQFEKEQLRQHIGVVLQDVFLFTGDVASNIRLNQTNIADESIMDIIEKVNATGFISKLPLGIHEPVQERGSTFSFGERQLLSFARALAYDPSILVLDEATSNIDTETETLIQNALVTLMEGRTTLIVAHRLSTIQHADQIIVMHKGKVREKGTHQALLQLGGLYHDLYELQYQERTTA